ncbi:rCG62255 [Rattus norvegicus]|uniref:RCG62255 n=1 Tax=Rattus norvegicus TaxID=10116 RepID=A6HBH8_RAT|nr:rCG62255 [Rattus norvegicus]
MLCNREQWALCERLLREQPQVQNYSALHQELCRTKIREMRNERSRVRRQRVAQPCP